MQFKQEKKLMEDTFNQTILQTQIEIQEQTLKTISQEIHDNIGQQLSVSKFTLNTIETTDNKLLNDKIDTCKRIIGKAIQDLRDLSKSINNDAVEQQGLVAALKHELEIINKFGLNTSIEVIGISAKLNPQIELILFRIIQESLNNAIKHANATNIKTSLTYSINKLEITVEDNGIGFNTNAIKSKGIGLINIQNRCKVIDASFAIESQNGKGTQVKISIHNNQLSMVY
ncbi:MAG: sensor histidine kinase [Chitinophagaceae bacterium]